MQKEQILLSIMMILTGKKTHILLLKLRRQRKSMTYKRFHMLQQQQLLIVFGFLVLIKIVKGHFIITEI